ncbi:MAG: glycosyltransferase family 2 protein [Gammaproteobacteria bacterium]|nr:glycosyltransferase family 2 protein [Gammaproteobacteria bacterium]
MATLSVTLIVKNEEKNLAECLDTVTWADEIVVLDAGSEDRTIEIAKQYTDKVYINADWQGYGIQRQRLQEFSSGDWILMLDADERLTSELISTIKNALNADDRNLVYALPRLSWCFGDFIRHSGWYPDYVTRLYAKDKAQYGEQLVHEKLEYGKGMKLVKLKGDLLHYTYRDLEHYLVKSAGYASAWAEQRQKKGKSSSLSQGFLHGVACFLKMYVFRLGFLDGRQGLLLAMLSGHSTFAKYADLWVRQQKNSSTVDS